jgi:hypothetical protein
MSVDYPYMASVKNVPGILAKIRGAGSPPKFTNEFLRTNLGFTSSSDRGVIAVLKRLGLLASDGTPLPRYNDFRAQVPKSSALAQGLRDGWPEIFLSNQAAHKLSSTDLVGVFKSVSGKGDAVAQKMATTFRAFSDQADWSGAAESGSNAQDTDGVVDQGFVPPSDGKGDGWAALGLHHDVHIHLPPSSDVSVYRAIFRALKEELGD